MNELITIKSVRGRLDSNENVELNLEDVARGLGFTQVAKSGNTVVRWERVRGYLLEYGIPTSGDGKESLPEFISESIFYKLCFKAENQTALKFQDMVTEEILPSIRKHGGYLTPAKIQEVLLNPDTIIQLATNLKEKMAENDTLKNTVKEKDLRIADMQPKVNFANAVATSHTSILVGDLAKLLKQNGVDIGANRLFEWLRENGYLIKRKGVDWNMPTQKSMDLGLFEIKESTVNNPDGSVRINKTPKVTGYGQQYFINIFLVKEDGIDGN